MEKISFIFGTRPEFIKLAPVIQAFRKHLFIEVDVCFTGQHREMVEPLFDLFRLYPNRSLNLMSHNQTLSGLTAKSINEVTAYLKLYDPDYVVVQGDTTTVMSAALAAFYQKKKVLHVEAGLRTGDKYSPFPEEMNRLLTSKIADVHFAPTSTAKQNLLKEGIPEKDIVVTGNTVIDSLFFIKNQLDSTGKTGFYTEDGRRIILVTGHRRENLGEGFINICKAILHLADKYPQCDFVYPVHLNPNVRATVFDMLTDRSNIMLIEPLEYNGFVDLMSRAHIVLTDSGGVQEEAPSLGKPVLVMRENTERPEAVAAGTVKLVGTDIQTIIREFSRLMDSEEAYEDMARAMNPYGDGYASERIVRFFEQRFLKTRKTESLKAWA